MIEPPNLQLLPTTVRFITPVQGRYFVLRLLILNVSLFCFLCISDFFLMYVYLLCNIHNMLLYFITPPPKLCKCRRAKKIPWITSYIKRQYKKCSIHFWHWYFFFKIFFLNFYHPARSFTSLILHILMHALIHLKLYTLAHV